LWDQFCCKTASGFEEGELGGYVNVNPWKPKTIRLPSGPVCRNTRIYEEEEVEHLPVSQGLESTEGAT